ncbi:MAG: zinc-ribbon domain-containing protein, partial [Oscillospiraceae bacterium]|nr:zinc-ribbon domain-containing protein [Oscillospiraceae bacterium]
MAFCKHCGNQLPDDAAFCSNCGTPVDNAQQTGQQDVQQNAQQTGQQDVQ